jgi:hypothetical protein
VSWDVAGVRITRVVESILPFPVDFLAKASPADVAAEAWLVPEAMAGPDEVLTSRTGAHRLKGLTEETEVFRVAATTGAPF